MSTMMEILKQIQGDLAEQKDYMRNLHKHINKQFNLMEGKIDQQRDTIEMLEQQVRKNNVLLFGNDEAEIDIKDKTNLNNKKRTGHLVEQSEKYIENTEANNSFKSADVVECNPESNAGEYVKMNKNEIGEFTPNEVKEIKELIRDYIETTRSSDKEAGNIKELIRDYIETTRTSDEEAGGQIRKQETVQIWPTYFSTEQMNKLNMELKQITEKYQSTNIFPVIEVIPPPLVKNHPVLTDLSKRVYYEKLYSYKGHACIEFKRSDIVEMITENPNVTLHDVVKKTLESKEMGDYLRKFYFHTPFIGYPPNANECLCIKLNNDK